MEKNGNNLTLNNIYQEIVKKKFPDNYQSEIKKIEQDLYYSTYRIDNEKRQIKTIRKLDKIKQEKLSILGKIKYQFSLRNIKDFMRQETYNTLFMFYLDQQRGLKFPQFNLEVLN